MLERWCDGRGLKAWMDFPVMDLLFSEESYAVMLGTNFHRHYQFDKDAAFKNKTFLKW